ncbi:MULTISPECIES: YrhK family protein [unclassified Micromonospora]|uniref:YrhK family protein n=1 Tax=unclassified Micromonospora TaxID=2617518 RepID=UPI003331AD9B
MSPQNLTPRRRQGLLAFIRRYPLVHLAIGLVGNILFLIGSVLFVANVSHVAKYFFLSGSFAMVVGSLGEVVKALGRRILQHHDVDPSTAGVVTHPSEITN